jgi:hypothetical protein
MRFHFTIRDLLWLTLVAGMESTWWLDHRSQAKFYQLGIQDSGYGGPPN